ncbi:MAG: VOC family protein [Chthoniobacteraceae bacterium]
MSNSQNTNSHVVVWFEIPADKPERAQSFYNKLFGWNISPMPGAQDYWFVNTGQDDGTRNGGMIMRKHETQPITNYISVPSVSEFSVKVQKLGGTVCKPKTAVPTMGYFAVCRDTENNEFAIWEMDEQAK